MRCQEALPLLEKALSHYLAAFHQKHPRLSHAHEGIAECQVDRTPAQALPSPDLNLRPLSQS